MKLSITSLFSVQIMSYLGASDIIYSNVIDSFTSQILKYKSWILASRSKRSWTVKFTPSDIINTKFLWQSKNIGIINYCLPFVAVRDDTFRKLIQTQYRRQSKYMCFINFHLRKNSHDLHIFSQIVRSLNGTRPCLYKIQNLKN